MDQDRDFNPLADIGVLDGVIILDSAAAQNQINPNPGPSALLQSFVERVLGHSPPSAAAAAGGGKGGPWGARGGGGGDNRNNRNNRNKNANNGNQNDDPFANVTFANIRGLDAQIAYLQTTIVEHLNDTTLANCFGIKPPKGILFHGPPGTGKTLLARAFGNEVSEILGKKVAFYHRKGNDLKDKWFGGSEQLVRELFANAAATKPSIIFIDELDGVCPSRDGEVSEGSRSLVTAILGQIDAVVPGDVFVFAATNRLNALDPAVIRPGRFDAHLEFKLPDLSSRMAMLALHTSKWPNSSLTLDENAALLRSVGERTIGSSGAEIEQLVREAFLEAFSRHIPDTSEEDASLAAMEVLPQDWDNVLKNFRPGVTNCFGYTTFVPDLPNPLVSPLVAGIQNGIMAALQPHLPARAQDEGQSPQQWSLLRTFFIWDEKNAMDILHSYVLPGLLANPGLCGHQIFSLTKQDVLTAPDPHDYVSNTLDRLVRCNDPAILYLPDVEPLTTATEHPEAWITHLFWRNLDNLKGKPVLILATGSQDPVHLEHPNLQELFLGENKPSFEIGGPDEWDRSELFSGLIAKITEKFDPVPEEKMAELWTSLSEMTNTGDLHSLIKLYDHLNCAIVSSEDQEQATVRIKAVMRRFARGRLNI